VYREATGANKEAADRWMVELISQQRYRVDVWGSA
jgi:hypothetical protein